MLSGFGAKPLQKGSLLGPLDSVPYLGPGGYALARSAQQALRDVTGISIADYGATPASSSAQVTAALYQACLAAIAAGHGRVFIPPGVWYFVRLPAQFNAGPVGITLVGMGRDVSRLVVDPLNWPYATSGAPLIDLIGTWRRLEVGFDQSWKTSRNHPDGFVGPPNYFDGRNPDTWVGSGGGYWIVRALQGADDTFEDYRGRTDNCVRGFFSQALDKTKGGVGRYIVTNPIGDAPNSDSQTIYAAEAPLSAALDQIDLRTTRWIDSDANGNYISNGLSAIFIWGGQNIRVNSMKLRGYQWVYRGPASQPWLPLTTYSANNEIRYNLTTSYRVVNTYTTGTTFGAIDLANLTPIFSPMVRFRGGSWEIDAPIGDTACYNGDDSIIDSLSINDSGDMGFAGSGSIRMHVNNLNVIRVRNGPCDVAGGGSVTVGQFHGTDYARASGGVFSRIDSLNPGVWASNGGPNLALISLGLSAAPGTKKVAFGLITGTFQTPPPATDGGPNNGGQVAALVQGVFVQTSSDPAVFSTVTAGNIILDDYETTLPLFFVNIPTACFYSEGGGITGVPSPGEVFVSGSVKFVLCASRPAGSLVHVMKFQGAQAPYPGQVFRGKRSNATITANLTGGGPQYKLLGSSVGNYVDYTSKYLGDTINDRLVGAVTITSASAIAAGNIGTIDIPVMGAVSGRDGVATLFCPAPTGGLVTWTEIPAASVVRVFFFNPAGGSVKTPPLGQYSAIVCMNG